MKLSGLAILCLIQFSCGGSSESAPISRSAAIDLLLSSAPAEERGPCFIHGLTSEDPFVAEAARAGLRAMGREGVPYLIQAVRFCSREATRPADFRMTEREIDDGLLYEALWLLQENREDQVHGVNPLYYFLTMGNLSIEQHLLFLAEPTDPDLAESVAGLTALSSHPDPQFREKAKETLLRLRPPAAPVVPPAEPEADAAFEVAAQVDALANEDRWVRLRAIEALGRIGPAALPAEAALTRILTGDDGEARAFAARALADIGPGAAGSIPALRRAVLEYDEDLHFVSEALRAIALFRLP